jgi:hypothetical protein
VGRVQKDPGGAGFRRGGSARHIFWDEMKTCFGCGKEYGHAQKWWHENCEGVANSLTDLANTTFTPLDVANTATNNVANASNKTYKYRDVEKRRAYQREYMRRKRK